MPRSGSEREQQDPYCGRQRPLRFAGGVVHGLSLAQIKTAQPVPRRWYVKTAPGTWMYPAAAGGEREAKVAPFAGSHEGRGRMPDPEFIKT